MKKLIFLLLAAAMLFAGCGEKGDEITAERAKEIALQHAGVNSDSAKFVRTQRDRDDGRIIYDVEFYSDDSKEYDYEIDAKSGEVITWEAESVR